MPEKVKTGKCQNKSKQERDRKSQNRKVTEKVKMEKWQKLKVAEPKSVRRSQNKKVSEKNSKQGSARN